MQIQQGDVIGHKVDKIPATARRVQPVGGRLIVAEGEATGHAHAIQATPDVALFECDGKMYLDVAEPAIQTHEEHAAVTWGRGVWEIGTVREKDWFEDVVRPVID